MHKLAPTSLAAEQTSPTRERGSWRRPAVNITPVERIGRIVLGALIAVAGMVLLVSANVLWVTVFEVLLVATGLDLVITGALGHCPLYRKLGYAAVVEEPVMSQSQPHETQHDDEGHRGGHGWMMVACCVPMLVLAVVLVAAGVVSAGFLLVAVGCTAMMALMMRGMSSGPPRTR